MADPTVYQPTTWVDNTTPLSAQNLNNLETQYQDAQELMQSRYAVAHGPMLIALCGFDGSLNTTRGVRGTFTRASSANNPATLAAEGDNVPSYVPGYWGNSKGALAIWEGTTNLVYNSGFETVTTTAFGFQDPLTSGAAWTVQNGSFTYSASGATSGANGSLQTAGNSAWKPLLGSDGVTSLDLTGGAVCTTPATLGSGTYGQIYLYENGSNLYTVFITNASFVLGKIVAGTYTQIAVASQTISASTTYTMTLQLDHLGNLTARLYAGSGTGGTLLETLTASDTSLTGGFLLGVGGDAGVVITSASMGVPFANGWTVGGSGSVAWGLTQNSIAGKYSLSAVNTQSVEGFVYQSVAYGASESYTLSGYVSTSSGGTGNDIEWDWSATPLEAQIPAGTNAETRYTVTNTSPSTAGSADFYCVTRTAGTYVFDCLQIEQKGYASPYAENDSTTATATRANETDTIPMSGMSTAAGYVRGKARCDCSAFNSTSGPTLRLFDDSNDHISAFAYATNWAFGVGGPTNGNVANNIPAGEWFEYVLTWNGTTAEFYVNGSLLGSAPQQSGGFGASMSIGSYMGDNEQWDGPIDDFTMGTIYLTPAQVYSLYSATVPLIDTYATPVTPDTDTYNSASSSPDANDVYTVVTYTRRDGTTYLVSTLSGTASPAGSSNYPNLTWQYYDLTGTVVVRTQSFALAYDGSSKLISQTMTD